MSKSIIEESKEAKNRGIFKFLSLSKKKIAIIIICGIVIITAFYFISNQEKDGTEKTAKTKEFTVKKDDIRVSIESDGKVVAEDSVNLYFSVRGDTLEIETVFVNEGDKIAKGDPIAAVKTEDLNFSLRTAQTNYASALASYQAKVAEATTNEILKAQAAIDQAKISLEQSQISLENTKINSEQKILEAENSLKTAENNLKLNDAGESTVISDAYQSLTNTIKSVNIEIENALNLSDSILGQDNKYINDDFEYLLGAKDQTTINPAYNSYEKTKDEYDLFKNKVLALNENDNYDQIESVAYEAKKCLETLDEHLYSVNLLLESTQTSTDLSQSELDNFKSQINSAQNNIINKINSLNNSLQSVYDANNNSENTQMNYEKAVLNLESTKTQAEQDIINAELQIKNKGISLEQANISYDELLEPLKDYELASADAQLASAQINLDKAIYNMEQATLKAPIDGEIALLNYKSGDIIDKDNINDPVATIINTNTLFIEVNIEEADVNNLKVGQKALATFDAVEDAELEGAISFISLISSTNNNGIVTYLVRIIFENPENLDIREGMTAFIDFILSDVSDILIAPVSAVRNISGKPSVELVSGEIKQVTTGFTDGKYVEIISGLEEGDKILY